MLKIRTATVDCVVWIIRFIRADKVLEFLSSRLSAIFIDNISVKVGADLWICIAKNTSGDVHKLTRGEIPKVYVDNSLRHSTR